MLTRSIPPRLKRDVLVGQLFADNTCCLGTATVGGRTPVLSACRELIARGIDPETTVEIFRNGTLTLRISTLAAGARLTVEECSDGRPRFRQHRPRPSEGSSRIAQSVKPVGAAP
jgi:hypothetical protein